MHESATPMRHYYKVVVRAISLDRKASWHDAAYDRTVLAESRLAALAKCQEEILTLECNDPTIKRISVYIGTNSRAKAPSAIGHWSRQMPLTIVRRL